MVETKEVLGLIILLFTFLIINKVSIWVNGSTLEATNVWIGIIISSLLEALIAGLIIWWLKNR